LWIALDYCERERRSLNVFFGDTYGTEISQATNFAGSIRWKITSWISIDKRGVDLISDTPPFGRLWSGDPSAVANAIGYASIAVAHMTP
jgi:hypothetical protein